MPAPALPLAVVIPTHNRRAILERTLDALGDQSRRDFRIVVVDDGSTDGTWEWLEMRAVTALHPSLSIVRQANRGQGQARNHGVRQVEEALVLFLGDDVIPCRELVAEHLRRALPAGRRVLAPRRRRLHRLAAERNAGHAGARDGERRGPPVRFRPHAARMREVPFTCFYTSNISLPRRLLGDEPFDPRVLGLRLGRHRARLPLQPRRSPKLVYHPAASAEHLHPMTLGELFARQLLVGRGRATLCKLHPELAATPLLSPAAPPRWFAASKRLVPRLLPLLSALDGAGVPLGRRLLHRVLICGYYLGQEAA
jgi:hypothetical protein